MTGFSLQYHDFWGDFIYTVLLGMILTLTCESPIIALEKVIFGARSSPKSVNRNKNNETKPNLDDNVDGDKNGYSNQNMKLDGDGNRIVNNIHGNDITINLDTEESRTANNS